MNVLNFATADSYVEWSLLDLPHNLVTGFTIAFWANITATDLGGVVFSEEIVSGADLTGLTLDFGGSNFLYFVDKGATPSQYADAGYAGTWHHFAYVFTGTNVNLYIDGALILAGSGPLTQGFKKGSRMRLGKSYAGDLPSSTFKICNFHLYLRELTIVEIVQLMQYQGYYFTDLETFFKLDKLSDTFINSISGARYSYTASGVTLEDTNALDIYNFKYGNVVVPQATIGNALMEPQFVSIPKMISAGELLLQTEKDLTGCSILELLIKNSAGQQILAPIDPYVWYHFDETSGIVIKDSSKNSRYGTLFPGSGGGFIPGKLGNAILFVGDTYVNGGDIAGFEFNQPFSLEAWIYFTNDGYPRTIMSRIDRTAQNRGFSFFTNDGYLTLYISSDESIGKTIYVYTNIQVGDAAFHHVVATYSGSGLASGIKLYIDGVQQSVGISADGLAGGTILNSAKFTVGCANGIDLYYFGSIDEVVVYSQVLTQDQIDFRYNSGLGTEIMIQQSFVSAIPGQVCFSIPPLVLATPGEYQVQLKYGNDVFVDYSPIHKLEILDTLD